MNMPEGSFNFSSSTSGGIHISSSTSSGINISSSTASGNAGTHSSHSSFSAGPARVPVPAPAPASGGRENKGFFSSIFGRKKTAKPQTNGQAAVPPDLQSEKMASKIPVAEANVIPETEATPVEAHVVPDSFSHQGGVSSVADEISKLKGLLDEGVLSEEEFREAKAKLLDKL